MQLATGTYELLTDFCGLVDMPAKILKNNKKKASNQQKLSFQMVYELSRKEMFWSMKTEKLVSKVMENITEENPTLNKSEKNWG